MKIFYKGELKDEEIKEIAEFKSKIIVVRFINISNKKCSFCDKKIYSKSTNRCNGCVPNLDEPIFWEFPE